MKQHNSSKTHMFTLSTRPRDFRRWSLLRPHVFLMKGEHRVQAADTTAPSTRGRAAQTKALAATASFWGAVRCTSTFNNVQKLIRCWWKVWGHKMKLSLLLLKSLMPGIQTEVGPQARPLQQSWATVGHIPNVSEWYLSNGHPFAFRNLSRLIL